jgi:hypothetical protein
MMSKPPITASCKCGSVKFEATGKAIMSVVCYCDDCQEGARKIEMLPDALPVPDADGGTGYLLYRKDRLGCIKGDQLLKSVRIREHSPTRRVVASCCNSAMFLEFEKGHWLSVYRARFTDDTPPVEMRIQTRFKPKDADIPNDAPSNPAFPLKFMVKLMSARIAMLLHR